MIRDARIADMPDIVELGRRLHVKTPYADVPEDISTVGSTLGQCISSALGFAMVAVHEGRVTGFMLGAAMPLWFSKMRSATDIVTYAESPGDGYRLIKAFVNWAWSTPKVIEITMAQSSGVDIDRTGVLYERAGLHRVGSLFTAVKQNDAAEVAA